MKICVRLGEPFWRAVGSKTMDLVLPEGADVTHALRALAAKYPELERDLFSDEIRPTILVKDDEARLDTRLEEGTRLTLLWPISGGRC
ncbi:MAG: MoaD/ThiS family protein [Chloroflexota bacterium]